MVLSFGWMYIAVLLLLHAALDLLSAVIAGIVLLIVTAGCQAFEEPSGLTRIAPLKSCPMCHSALDALADIDFLSGTMSLVLSALILGGITILGRHVFKPVVPSSVTVEESDSQTVAESKIAFRQDFVAALGVPIKYRLPVSSSHSTV